ncbi:MAG: 2-C-methyl-D-erythritol 4-phosphate cytidylyltransferase [Pantoea sp. Brub]|nr:2-C-methyl-D-erythritol 4-phosphate cytidylyltransferase [Pantoea sp. Brub]
MNNNLSCQDVIAIVPAAGVGSRMNINFPKQYLKIGQYTILEHSIFALFSHFAIEKIIVVLTYRDRYFTKLKLSNHPKIFSVIGGKTRAESVLAGIKAIHNCNWVIVHDASRPCLHPDDLINLMKIRNISNVGGILAFPVNDTIKSCKPGKHIIQTTVNRLGLWHAVTPQIFPHYLLMFCLEKTLSTGIKITDESSALEYCGYNPIIVHGRRDNIKITYPEDLSLAHFYLKTNNLTNNI